MVGLLSGGLMRFCQYPDRHIQAEFKRIEKYPSLFCAVFLECGAACIDHRRRAAHVDVETAQIRVLV